MHGAAMALVLVFDLMALLAEVCNAAVDVATPRIHHKRRHGYPLPSKMIKVFEYVSALRFSGSW